MNLPASPIIVVLGIMTRIPVGGVIWQTLHYLIGLRRLGFDVYYVEDHGMSPVMFCTGDDRYGTRGASKFIHENLVPYGFGDRWSYRMWNVEDGEGGLSQTATRRLFANAAAVINLSGGTAPQPRHRTPGAFIYLETDPVAPEIELHNRLQATADFMAAHTAHLTFGENLGAADCKVPVPPAPLQFEPTRQPVVLDLWPSAAQPGPRFTTVANWRQPQRQMTFAGEIYHWSKHYEFMKFLELPQVTSQGFELALSSYEESDRQMLETFGWKVRPALAFSGNADAYRAYITQSRGEWTVAKDQNVRLRSGWFSDRAATYLAAARPVITQETGFSNILPTGAGLFAFSTMDEILTAIEAINSNYEHHSHSAREIAREYFSDEVVLPRMLKHAGVSLPAHTARTN
jgi:hypothetical protein